MRRKKKRKIQDSILVGGLKEKSSDFDFFRKKIIKKS
jgi:hypothetical protein